MIRPRARRPAGRFSGRMGPRQVLLPESLPGARIGARGATKGGSTRIRPRLFERRRPPARAYRDAVALTVAERSRRYRARRRLRLLPPGALAEAVVASGPNEAATEATIEALRGLARLGPEAAAIAALARTTARNLDAATAPAAVAALGRVHALAVAALVAGPDRGADHDLDAFLASLRDV